MSEDDKSSPSPPPTGGTTPAERAAAYIAAKMPAWWRPEYQSAAAYSASTVPPAPATVPDVAATVPPPPPAPPQPPAAVMPPVVAPPAVPPSRQGPPSHEAKTMVLGAMPTAPPVAILTVSAGPDMGFKFRIKPTAITRIGRETDNDVVLDDKACSRHHAQIQFQDGKYVLTDLGSANGTLVNDQRVTERSLSDGDVIKVGQNVVLTSIKA